MHLRVKKVELYTFTHVLPGKTLPQVLIIIAQAERIYSSPGQHVCKIHPPAEMLGGNCATVLLKYIKINLPISKI